MYKIIGPQNKVNYGVIDEPVNFNYKAFKLFDFFGKEIKGLKKKITFHSFNYVGILTDQFLLGIAAVRLSYANSVFAYLYHFDKGMLYEYDIQLPADIGLSFPANPDEYNIEFNHFKSNLKIRKSHRDSILELDAFLEGKLKIQLKAVYGMESHKPLRVLNPSDPSRWTFTEKCAPIQPDMIEIQLSGESLKFNKKQVTLLYDWSGGYLKRETNWYWAAFSGILQDRPRTSIGGNFAALTNESFFSENAFWVNNKRTRTYQCIFDYNPLNPYDPWHIWDEAGKVDIRFYPKGERQKQINFMLVKTAFRQFFGTFQGKLKPKNRRPVEFEKIWGFTELHRAIW